MNFEVAKPDRHLVVAFKNLPRFARLRSAMKMIVDREELIKAFVPVEYWTFGAKLEAGTPPPFIAKLTRIEDKKAEVANEQDARKIEARRMV